MKNKDKVNNKNKDKVNNKDKDMEKLEYDILGNAFIGGLFNMEGDLDNSSQNLLMYLESNKIQKLNKDIKHRR